MEMKLVYKVIPIMCVGQTISTDSGHRVNIIR